ncbi:MAG: L-serine ammonia-lyase, iron-sulfur-dependent subunit beta [Clostridia bacterium]|nr:L-serine ammonia-lyase, iron-sulfur-dependent subunit beta [Clostridia bacterium]
MDLFDIIGPVMTGPSSSHTAGAARIGFAAKELLGEEVVKATITLHGSFADTYKGHGTDRALLAGLMGMPVDDPQLRYSLEIAAEKGLEFQFVTVELADAHPNTAILDLVGAEGGVISVRASSVGGGNIRIDEINGMAVSFRVSQDTLVIRHRDMPGVIAGVSTLIARYSVNIATMQVFRTCEGGDAIMAIEVDAPITEALRDELRREKHVRMVACVRKFG